MKITLYWIHDGEEYALSSPILSKESADSEIDTILTTARRETGHSIAEYRTEIED